MKFYVRNVQVSWSTQRHWLTVTHSVTWVRDSGRFPSTVCRITASQKSSKSLLTMVSIIFRVADIHFMSEYLYRNDNNDERQRGGKKHDVLFTRSVQKWEEHHTFLSTILIGPVTPHDCSKFIQRGHKNSFLPVPFIPGSGFMNKNVNSLRHA